MPEQLYWGDIHNHCAVGYAQGSLERAYDIARSHLEVFAFTGHAQWHDMPLMPGDRHLKWVDGCQVHQEHWPLVQQLAKQHNQPGEFVALLAYEWHSSEFGDYCLYYPDDDRELRFFDHLDQLQAYAHEAGLLALPHHPGYAPGWRGVYPAGLDPELTPTIEVFSEHGNAENDRESFDYLRHSNGGRFTEHTIERLWSQGHRLGVTAGTDDHLGYPGAYLEGLTGFWAPSLTRGAIFEALRQRRVYGVTGDRIALDFSLNEAPMGSVTTAPDRRQLRVEVNAPDELDRVEVLRGTRVIERYHPVDLHPQEWSGRGHVRVEFGWGPWAALDLERVCDWRVSARVNGGEILRALPCFQSGPFDEPRRNRIDTLTDHECIWRSYTSRRQAIGERATNAVILEIAGGADTVLEVEVDQPAPVRVGRTLGELTQTNAIVFTGGFTSESLVLHRAVPEARSTAVLDVTDYGDGPNYYRVKVRESNGQLAWSSPIWVEG